MGRIGGGLEPVTVILHGISHLDEAGDVASDDKRWEDVLGEPGVFASSAAAGLEAFLHDILELLVDLFGGPGEPLGVLGHFQPTDCYTTGVGGLAGSIPHCLVAFVQLAVSLEMFDGSERAAHVGAFGDVSGSALDEALGFGAGDFVLSGAGEGDVDFSDVEPRAGAVDVDVSVSESVGGCEGRQLFSLILDLHDGSDFVGGDGVALVADDQGALAVAEGDDGSAELDNLQCGVLRNVSGTRDGNTLAGKAFLAAGRIFDHVLDVLFPRLPSVIRFFFFFFFSSSPKSGI